MASRSLCLPPARTHFWTVVARGNGAGSSPRKYGTNCIIPEFVNIGAVGWCGIRPADGTFVCPRSAKKSVNAARSSVACMSRPIYPCWLRAPPGQARPSFVGPASPADPERYRSRSSTSRSRAATLPSSTAARTARRGRVHDVRRLRPLELALHGALGPDGARRARGGSDREPDHPLEHQASRGSSAGRPRSRRAARPVPLAIAAPLMTGFESTRNVAWVAVSTVSAIAPVVWMTASSRSTWRPARSAASLSSWAARGHDRPHLVDRGGELAGHPGESGAHDRQGRRGRQGHDGQQDRGEPGRRRSHPAVMRPVPQHLGREAPLGLGGRGQFFDDATGLRRPGQVAGRLGQVVAGLGQADRLDRPGGGVGHEERTRIGVADVLGGEDDHAAGQEPRVLPAVEHVDQPGHGLVGVGVAHPLDERAGCVVVGTGAVALVAGAERGPHVVDPDLVEPGRDRHRPGDVEHAEQLAAVAVGGGHGHVGSVVGDRQTRGPPTHG